MNNLYRLLKINFYNLLDLNIILHEKNKKERIKTLSLASVFALLPIILMIYIYLYLSLITETFYKLNLINFLVGAIFAIISFTILFTSIYKVHGLILGTKDYDLLNSLPIPNYIVILSKWISLYILNIFSTVLILIPLVIHYSNYMHPNIMFYILLIITGVLIPLIPMSVGCLIGIGIKYISNKFKYSQLIYATIVMSLVLGMLYSFTNINPDHLIKMLSDFTIFLNHIYPLTKIYIKSLCEYDFTSLVIFISLNISIITFVIYFISKNYVTLNNLKPITTTKKQNIKLQNHSLLRCLYEKELKRYLSSSIYVLNTVMGLVMLLFGTVAIMIKGIDDILIILEMSQISTMINAFIPLIICMVVGLSNTAVSSISLESYQFWIIKSLPIPPIKIFIAKILVNLTVTIPLSLINVLLLASALKLSITTTIFHCLLIISYCIFNAMLGIIINLYFPKLDWKNEVSVVKQSAATFISILITFISIGLLIGITYILNGHYLINIIFFVVIVIFNIVLYWYLATYGQEKFRKL